jgi:hypothetical protein
MLYFRRTLPENRVERDAPDGMTFILSSQNSIEVSQVPPHSSRRCVLYTKVFAAPRQASSVIHVWRAKFTTQTPYDRLAPICDLWFHADFRIQTKTTLVYVTELLNDAFITTYTTYSRIDGWIKRYMEGSNRGISEGTTPVGRVSRKLLKSWMRIVGFWTGIQTRDLGEW